MLLGSMFSRSNDKGGDLQVLLWALALFDKDVQSLTLFPKPLNHLLRGRSDNFQTLQKGRYLVRVHNSAIVKNIAPDFDTEPSISCTPEFEHLRRHKESDLPKTAASPYRPRTYQIDPGD
jgi:hypothetical protein